MQNAVIEYATANPGWCRAIAVNNGARPRDLDDIVQDAALSLLEHPPLAEVRSPKAYAIRCIQNAVRSFYRRSWTREVVSTDWVDSVTAQRVSVYGEPEGEMAAKDLAESIMAALRPFERRALARALDGNVRGAGRRELARLDGNERVYLFRARQRVRRLLTAC